ncbi:response regulator transcription factor [Streptomyces panaciradicis]|uniref:response regulator transcription factor n=1 Tax=Streptomyces panaciradicis TaxID=1470261 RepID=UPI00201D0D7F|nr:response regulator transcription factor [Streptomyces panaciradicis]MCL6673234.1 response regulator transcription factor [Streptomyces panaciradicis]
MTVTTSGTNARRPRARILLVEDDEPMAELLEASLRHEGYDTVTIGSGRECLAAGVAPDCDLLLLDVTLPDLDGFEVCGRLRSAGCELPVIFLTARDSRADLRTGFARGCDDYLTKPFSLEELTLRIAAVLRRSGRTGQVDRPLQISDLVLDDRAHRVTRGGQEVVLSPTEYRILRYLLEARGQVLSKAQIIEAVWGHAEAGRGDGNLVEAHISQLRRKLDVHGPDLIHTVRGFGYVLRSGT